jgi:hypothetical protein
MPYKIGDTVRLRAEFKTFLGALADPTSISLTIHDISTKVQIGTTITIGTEHKVSLGIFQYDYEIPDRPRDIYARFTGVLESKDIVNTIDIEIDVDR